MNKAIYFITSFFISILTIFITLFTNPESFYGWLAFVIIILSSPFVLHKLCKTTQVSKNQKVLFGQIVILLITLIFAWQNIFPPRNDYLVTVTESLDKANEIQEFLITPTRPTKLEIIPEEKNHPKSYTISVKRLSHKQNRLVTHQLLNSDLFDGSFTLAIDNITHTNNRLKMLKRVKQECENILYGIEGITWLELKIVPPENINDDNAKIKSITVRYETEENADSQKIRKKVETFINSIFKNSTAEIIIEDLEANSKAYDLIVKAQDEFEKKNYLKATELVKEASILNNRYSSDIDTIPRIIKIDKKTKNYQDYIEMGDLLSSGIFTTSIYANFVAIKNYEKALGLNSGAYEVYEKIGHAYTSLSMQYSILSDFSTDSRMNELKQEFEEKSIEYYLKAIEHSQGNNRVYQPLAYYYYCKEDYNKALEYYNKIDIPDDYSKKQYIYNKKVYANLKTGHYIEAWKESKYCSVWLCKLVHFNFAPDEI